MVWWGELYARQVSQALGITKYVDYYGAKFITHKDKNGVKEQNPEYQPDIAIDDIQDCELGKLNLIVRQK